MTKKLTNNYKNDTITIEENFIYNRKGSEIMENIKTPKNEVDNKYLETLAIRLKELRKDNGDISQEEFVKDTGIMREKINYAELNIKGRKLQIEELAEIANKYNISLDYLVGLTNKKTTISKEDLSNKGNIANVIEDNSATELERDLSKVTSKTNNEEIYKFYKSLIYITNNTLTSTFEKVKNLIERKSQLSSLYLNNISSAYYFIVTILNTDIFEITLSSKTQEILEIGLKALGNILNYNEDKELPMFYEDIVEMKKELETISDYLLYNLSNRKIEKQIEDIAMENVSNERYYKETNEFIKQYRELHTNKEE